MASNASWRPGPDGPTETLVRSAIERLESGEREVVLDFSDVRRIGPAELRELEQLAEKAKSGAAAVVLRGVSVEVYKVLKLVAVAPGFRFA